MAISDDEEDDQTNRVARIYDNPLHSGNEKRLDENEARMAISESSDNQSEIGVNPGVEERGFVWSTELAIDYFFAVVTHFIFSSSTVSSLKLEDFFLFFVLDRKNTYKELQSYNRV